MAVRQAKADTGRSGSWLSDMLGNGFYLGAVIASAALTIVSGSTTLEGMRDFLGTPWLAVVGTFGIQFLVFILSWLVANEAFHHRFTKASGYLAAYVVAAAVSMVFSYSSFYYTFISDKDRAANNALRIQQIAARELPPIGRELQKAETDAHEDLIRSQPYVTWQENASRVIKVARESAPIIEKALKDQKEAARKDLDTLQRQVEASASQKGSAAEILKSAEADAVRLEAAVKAQKERYEPRRIELDDLRQKSKGLQADMDQEEKRGGTKEITNAGRGPVWKSIEAEFKALQPAIYQAEQTEKKERELLAARDNELKVARAKRDASNREIAEADKKLGLIEPDLKTTKKRVDTVSSGEKVDEVADRFRAELKKFVSDKKPENYEKAQEVCQLLHDEIRKARDSTVSSSLSCIDSGLAAKLKTLQGTVDRKSNFEGQCTRQEIVSDQGSFLKTAAWVKECLTVSGLNKAEVLAQINAEQEKRGEGVDPDKLEKKKLSIALTGLTDGWLNAWLALSAAVVIDLLVLLVALAGRSMKFQQASDSEQAGSVFKGLSSFNLAVMPGDTPDFAALKRILANLPLQSGTKETPLDLAAAGLMNDPTARGLLSLLAVERQARQVVEDGKAICYVTPVGYRILVNRYREYEKQPKPVTMPIFPSDQGAWGRVHKSPRAPSGSGNANEGPREKASANAPQDQWRRNRPRGFLTDD